MYHADEEHETRSHRVVLDDPVHRSDAAELSRRIFFVSEHILDFALVDDGEGIVAVDLVTRRATDPAQLARKLRYVVAREVRAQRSVEPKVVWRRPVPGEPAEVFDQLVKRGVAVEVGEGQVTLGEPVLSLMDYLDTRLRTIATEEFGAREYRYPTLLPTRALERFRYLESFPQLVMFVSRLQGDIDTYRDFVGKVASGRDVAAELMSHGGSADYCLPPTMCFHTYHQLADRDLPGPSLVVTSRGKSFRFESRYRRSLERLWDFTIREVVLLGPLDFVSAGREKLMERTFELLAELNLGGRCEVANDPFFAHADTAERVWSQHLLELKYEVRLPLAPGRDVAVCSFNRHEQLFGDAFGIREPGTGEPVHTGCVGYGLERLAYAFLCQHGADPAHWAADLRKAVAP